MACSWPIRVSRPAAPCSPSSPSIRPSRIPRRSSFRAASRPILSGRRSRRRLIPSGTSCRPSFPPFQRPRPFSASSCSAARRPRAQARRLSRRTGRLSRLRALLPLVYPGYYRHEALLLVFFIILHWLAAQGRGGSWPSAGGSKTIRPHGRCRHGDVSDPAHAPAVHRLRSRRRRPCRHPLQPLPRLGRLLKRDHLTQAVVMGDPDTDLEPLPYYANNPSA